MFFVLSQVAGFFIVPSNCVLLLVVVGVILLWTRYSGLGRTVTTLGGALLVVLGFFPVGVALTVPLESRFPRWHETAGPPTGIIVLGGAISATLSSAHGQVALNDAAERITAAVELARRYPASRIVFTGGFPSLFNSPIREADYAGDLLADLGVEKERIVLERDSRDTFENALYTRRMLRLMPGERWLLVTSAMHMPRAAGTFRNLGFDIEAYPVDYRSTGWMALWRAPSSPLKNMSLTDQAVHEWIGLLAYRLSGRTANLFPGPEQ